MDLLETRELRYFVAVAEELHFGRAAARLLVAQPALSKAVQRLEKRLGAQLLRRSSRSVSLTPAGLALLDHGRVALSAVASAAESARRAAGGEHLRLVIKPGGDANLLSGILAAYAESSDARPVDILFSGSVDRTAHVLDGRADVGLLYVPFDDVAGLSVHTLLVEGRVAVLDEKHPLARRENVLQQDLVGQTFVRWKGVDDVDRPGPVVADLAELIPLVRLGRAVAVLPRSLVAVPPPGIVLVPVLDAEPSSIVVARRADDHRPAVAALMEAAAAAHGSLDAAVPDAGGA